MHPKTYLETPLGNESELLSYFKPNQHLTIFDVGSCDGLDSIRYHRMFPNALVYLFEPLPGNVEEVQKNLAAFEAKNIQCFPIALSDTNGTLPFHVSSGKPEGLDSKFWDYGNKSGSLLPPGSRMKDYFPWLKFEQITEVPSRRLDDFAQEHGITTIDFLHLDVQGAELQVLQGATHTLKRIKVIWLEVESQELYKGQALKAEVEAYLSKKGFTQIKEIAQGVVGDQLWANLQFFPKKRVTRFLWQTWVALSSKKPHALL